MKKLLLICMSAFLLSACAEKEQYEQAVFARMKDEKDLKDYNIDPEKMTKCIVDTTSSNMPGSFPLAQERLEAYQNYAKMLNLNKSEDKQKTLEELRSLFGSPKELAAAHSNYTESVMNCIATVTSTSGDDGRATAYDDI